MTDSPPLLSEDPRPAFVRILATLLHLEPAWYSRGRLSNRLSQSLHIPALEIEVVLDGLVEQGALLRRWRQPPHSRHHRAATLLVDPRALRQKFPDFRPEEHRAPRLTIQPFAAIATRQNERETT